MQHGKDCEKVPHTGDGYLHAEDDDTPYDVDSVMYCGRCHVAIAHHCPALPIVRKARSVADAEGVAVTLAERIDELVAQHGSLRAVARVTEIDVGYLSRLRAGEKVNPEKDKLRRLGLRRVVSYEPLKTPNSKITGT